MNVEFLPCDAGPHACPCALPRRSTRLAAAACGRRLAGAALLLLMSLGQPCTAAPVTLTYDFAAAGFRPLKGTEAPPVDPVTGSVTVSFETSESRFNRTTGVALNRLDLPSPDSALAYSYRADLDQLIVGGAFVGAGGVIDGRDDFFVVIDHATTSAPSLFEVAYALASNGGEVWGSFTGSVSVDGGAVSDPPSGVPEPHAMALVLTALLAGAAARRRGLASPPA